MPLQTIVNLSCPDSDTLYAVAIRNADSMLNAAGSPIIDTYSATSGGWYWNFVTSAFAETCGVQSLSALQDECIGQSFTLPAQLHAPGRHYGINLWSADEQRWNEFTTYAIGEKVIVPVGTGFSILTATTGGDSGDTQPVGDGADGTVIWSNAVAATIDDFSCQSSSWHWTGDMRFSLEGTGGGESIAQGQTFCTIFRVKANDEVIDPDALFSNPINITASAGVLSATVNVDGSVLAEVDTTGVAVGTSITVSADVNVKASTNALAPICCHLTEDVAFNVAVTGALSLGDLIPGSSGGTDESGERTVGEAFVCLTDNVCPDCTESDCGCSCTSKSCWY